jgi:hypothetical protein
MAGGRGGYEPDNTSPHRKQVAVLAVEEEREGGLAGSRSIPRTTETGSVGKQSLEPIARGFRVFLSARHHRPRAGGAMIDRLQALSLLSASFLFSAPPRHPVVAEQHKNRPLVNNEFWSPSSVFLTGLVSSVPQARGIKNCFIG